MGREQLVDELLGHAVGAAVRVGVDDDRGRAEQPRFDREIGSRRALPMPGLGRDQHRRARAGERRLHAPAQLGALARAADAAVRRAGS